METMNYQLKLLHSYLNIAKTSFAKKPAGTLVVTRNKGHEQYFHRFAPNVKRGTYIPKKNMQLARDLAQKAYDQRFIQTAEALITKIENMIQNGTVKEIHYLYEELAQVYSSLSPERQKLVSPYVLPDDLFVAAWKAKEYEGKAFPEGTSEFLTENGERVRSKSEKIIADKLLKMGIPYRYEYPVKTRLMGTSNPDFTLLDIWNRKEVIYEHFGMMDEENYRNKTFSKIKSYVLDGYEIGDKLVFTFESKLQPLDIRFFEELMQDRFPHLTDM